MRSIKTVLRLFSCTALCLNACTLAPKYTRPAAPVPAQWPEGPAYPQASSVQAAPSAAELPWQQFFTDENLRKLIEAALANNRDLRIASLNVELARAMYGIQRAELYPSVYATGSGMKQGTSADLAVPGQSRTSEQYSANLGVLAWEIDFFGRIRSLTERALEEYFATEQARRSAQILLVSAVADAYMALAADRENLALAENTFKAQESTFAMVQRQYLQGVTNELSLRQAQTSVETARRAIAGYMQRVAQDQNALTLLLGGAPAPAQFLPADLGRISPLREVSSGTPSEVLLRRPDVLQAEALLRAANADIGAARAAFFPRISLTTALGTASEELHGLFDAHSGAWNYAAQIVMPIFDARVWSAFSATKVQQEIAVTQYEKAIQTAFREVADALAVRGTIDAQLAAQQALVDALAEVYRLSLNRYENGVDSYLSVLDSQRSLFAAQQILTDLRLANLASQVRLYAVLGGGCDPDIANG